VRASYGRTEHGRRRCDDVGTIIQMSSSTVGDNFPILDWRRDVGHQWVICSHGYWRKWSGILELSERTRGSGNSEK
jgi:hypothetical protein